MGYKCRRGGTSLSLCMQGKLPLGPHPLRLTPRYHSDNQRRVEIQLQPGQPSLSSFSPHAVFGLTIILTLLPLVRQPLLINEVSA